jgi:hypothetical protein
MAPSGNMQSGPGPFSIWMNHRSPLSGAPPRLSLLSCARKEANRGEPEG